jgi:two-component system, NarL family, sensor histidine kinase UhpB
MGHGTLSTVLARAAPLFPGPVSVRVYTVAIALGITGPALILAGYLAVNSAQLQRAQIEEDAKNRTRETTATIERDIQSIQDVLFSLAASPFLRSGNIAAFYDQAEEVSGKVGLRPVVLHDLQLRQLINTAFPYGTSLKVAELPPTNAAARDALLRSRKPVVSDIFQGPLLKKYIVAVMVPVFLGDELTYILAAGIPTKRFANLLEKMNIHADQSVGVFDRSGLFLARSAKADEFTGTRSALPLSSRSVDVLSGVGREGMAFHAFTQLSDSLGWTVSTAVADRVLEAPLRRAIALFAIVAALLLAVAIGLAYALGNRISRSLGALGIDRKPTREEFELLFESAPNGVMVVEQGGRIALSNGLMERTFGYARGELTGRWAAMLVPERLRGADNPLGWARMGDTRRAAEEPASDLCGLRKDASEFPMEVAVNPFACGSEKLMMVIVVDVSTRKLAAQRLATATLERDDLRRRFVQAQEQERLRLAHDLHDQTGQSLTAVMLGLRAVEDALDEAHRGPLRLLRLRLEQVGQTLHHIAWELRPASIDELGLASALANYFMEWSAQFGIETDFHYGEKALHDLPDEMATTLYRVAQEALTNVVKHARDASCVSIVIERNDSELRLAIEDNGCGFDAAALGEASTGRHKGLGLAGMRERLMLIGGTFEVESSTDSGTTVFARIPLQRRRTAA